VQANATEALTIGTIVADHVQCKLKFVMIILTVVFTFVFFFPQ
jgi:hypothetical protein